MKTVVKIMRRAAPIVYMLLIWLAINGLALAQEKKEEEAAKSYVLGYALTTICIALGLFVVVRMGKRKKKKIKRKDEDIDWD